MWNDNLFSGIDKTNIADDKKEATDDFLIDVPDFNDNYTIEMLTQKILTEDRQYDLSKILNAYNFAAKAHEGQKRSSGQDYIIHPLAVAFILLELSMDTDTICAALLHDVVEDTPVTLAEVRKRYGQDVAILVDGVTKLNQIPLLTKAEQQAENVRKILLAMSQDIRVMIIKLSDRLHNMRTLKYRPKDKQRATALETMNIYAPIAHRLGIRPVKEELEDLAFHYLDPYAYSDITRLLDSKKEEREEFISSIKRKIAERLENEHNMEFSKPPEIEGRVKSHYGIYKKLYVQHKNFDEIYDKYAVRVIVSTITECYCVLGLIHDMFRPLPNRFKDYISTPKANFYRSLHTTVLGKEGIPFEVQIRTWEMHRTAELGIAAHWKYKEGIKGGGKIDQRLSWVRQIIEAQQASDDVEEIVRIIKNDLTPEDIVVLTPNADHIILPVDSTPIDFAYRIHTAIGHKTIGAKVDGKMVNLDYKLQTGQICQIITSKDENKGPTRAWLDIVKTNEAKSKIRSWFKKECREENIERGKAELEREFKRNRIYVSENRLEEFLSDDMKRHNCDNLNDFYASIGYGGITLSKIIPRLKEKYNENYAEFEFQTPEEPVEIVSDFNNTNNSGSIILDEINMNAVKYAQCCNPLPGDEIIGFITRGHGISVHSTSCTNYQAALSRNDPEELPRWVKVEWPENSEPKVKTTISIVATERVGLLRDISAVLANSSIFIARSESRTLANGNAFFGYTITVSSKDQLEKVFEKLKKIKSVVEVKRSIAK